MVIYCKFAWAFSGGHNWLEIIIATSICKMPSIAHTLSTKDTLVKCCAYLIVRM
jgi:hypothetical protein